MYDAIIVGARVAGAPTAMLLARKGYKVLLVDKATFPSDTLSSHQLQIPGSVLLKKWGLLDQVLATNPGPARGAAFDMGYASFDGDYPELEGVRHLISPRRYILDTILVEAAATAGAEVRQGFTTRELIFEGERVIGIRGTDQDGKGYREYARIVIGADGRHSIVAKAVNAPKYHEQPTQTMGYYSYFSDLPLNNGKGEMYARGRQLFGCWPTNDGLTMIYTARPVSEFKAFRGDVERNYMATFDSVPQFAERIRAAKRVEPLRGAGDLPNFFRKPYGDGWALIGDAGFFKDPINGHGINDAFRDAALVATALDDGFSGRLSLQHALAGYQQKRDAESKPLYDFTLELAGMKPPAPEQIMMFQALGKSQSAANNFLGVMAGIVPIKQFLSPKNIIGLIGVTGMAKALWQKVFPPRAA
jgi:flavin-dependent dehydrogenase